MEEIKIGNTPLLRLRAIEKAFGLQAELYAKAEQFNAGGSIKDRVAKSILDEAEKSGFIKNGGTVVEATSGNTGVGLALVARARGYKAVIVMPDSMSEERRLLMKKYGAELVLTAGALGMQGAVEKAQEIVENTPNAFLASQFENPANPLAHYQTTAPEIWEQTNGDIDIFVAGVGTGGTLTGVAKFLKERKAVQIVALEPKESPLLSTGKAGPHKIQGIGANFVPAVLDKTLVDEVLAVGGDDAIAMAKTLNEFEKAYVGISSGANVLGAIALAKREENKGKKIVTVFPDSGDRYASIF